MKKLEEEMGIIYKIVWSYVKSCPGLVFEDLISEACIIYLENMDLYDESKGCRSTYIYHIVRNHINTLLSKKKEELIDDEMQDIYFSDEKNPEQILIQNENWQELFESFTPEAKEVCDFIFNTDIYLPVHTPRNCRGVIMRELRKNNWSWNKIWGAFSELKHI